MEHFRIRSRRRRNYWLIAALIVVALAISFI